MIDDKLYLIPGLGTDHRIFTRLGLGENAHYLDFVPNFKREKLSEYAKRMADRIPHDVEPILVGVSLGGVFAIEIQKIRPVKGIVLISSMWHNKHRGRLMRTAGRVPIHKYIPSRLVQPVFYAFGPRIGGLNEEETHLYKEMVSKTPPSFTKWAITRVLEWRNESKPENMIEIHGTHDHLFPISKRTEAKVIERGTHFMLVKEPLTIRQQIITFANELIANHHVSP